MVQQKTKKFRGSRTFGAGTHKNRRGGGSRGGRGNAGGCKHHLVKALQEGRPFGKYGFKRPLKVISKKATINIGMLDQISNDLLSAKNAKEKDGAIHIDIGKIGADKVLGGGKVTKKLVITASEFSETAKSKIESAGGKCVLAK
ncbi:MAG: 50S ribosomal protein L15 [Methanosarcinales archaeon]|nr:MAG: 50S ribosomal protein L15 [Methanosarcinales archaeon]